MNNVKNYKKGTRLEIIKLLHMGSVIPSKSLSVFDTPRTYKDKLRDMEREGILGEYRVKNDGHIYRVFVLNEFEKNRKLYSDYLPDGYYEQFVTVGQQAARDCRNKPGGTSMHVICGAETHILVKEAGVSCEPDTKPNLYKREPIHDDENVYYTSREIKGYTGYRDDIKKLTAKDGIGNEEKLVVSSRITGLLVTMGGVYAVYNLGRSITNWQRGGELKIKTHIDYMLGEKMAAPRSCDQCLLYMEDYASLSRVISPVGYHDDRAAGSFENLKYAYERIYALPYSLAGRKMLEVMMRTNWMSDLKDLFLARYDRNDIEMTGLPCDAVSGETNILLFCVPDVRKLQMFKRYADTVGDKQKFIVLCFDFQEEMVAKSCGMSCRILKTGFDKFYDQYMGDR